MDLKKILIRLLLFFYLSSSYLSGTHLHSDGLEENDCKVHILVKNFNSSDTHHNTFELSDYEHPLFFSTFTADAFIHTLIKGFDAQAPPFLS